MPAKSSVPPGQDDTKTLSQLEDETFSEVDSASVPPTDIVAYNELRSCADLYRMQAQGILEVQPDFQREVVWKSPDQTRFIDSLIKQLPIPSMCFALDHKAQRWMVIDGLQRISTIVRFLDGGSWRLAKLTDIEPAIAGKLVSELKSPKSPLHHYFTRVENLSVPVTVLRCDFSKRSHLEYLFTIFHRLNTGGMKLNNQEIRNCIFGGPLNSLLRDLDLLTPWRRINKMRPGETYRFTKQEIILRFLAFYDRASTYEGHLAKFLNDYMHAHQHATESFIDDKRTLFTRTVTCLFAAFGANAPKLAVTVLEALLVGVACNIDDLETAPPRILRQRIKDVLDDEEFSEAALREGLSKKPRVISRLARAKQIIAG